MPETALTRAQNIHEQACQKRDAAFEFYGLLRTMRDEKLYRELGHDTFPDYMENAHGLSYRRAKQMIDAEAVASKVNHGSPKQPVANERQARELAKVPEDEQAEVWVEVVEEAESEGRKPTANDVKRVANTRKPAKVERRALGDTTPDPEPPKKKNGAEKVSAKDRKDARAHISAYIKVAARMGIHGRTRSHTDAILEAIKTA